MEYVIMREKTQTHKANRARSFRLTASYFFLGKK
jgi:hypothetical protein